MENEKSKPDELTEEELNEDRFELEPMLPEESEERKEGIYKRVKVKFKFFGLHASKESLFLKDEIERLESIIDKLIDDPKSRIDLKNLDDQLILSYLDLSEKKKENLIKQKYNPFL